MIDRAEIQKEYAEEEKLRKKEQEKLDWLAKEERKKEQEKLYWALQEERKKEQEQEEKLRKKEQEKLEWAAQEERKKEQEKLRDDDDTDDWGYGFVSHMRFFITIMLFALVSSFIAFSYADFPDNKYIDVNNINRFINSWSRFFLIAKILIAILLGLTPAMIAAKKGHSFIEFWIYGSLLFVVALPYSLLMRQNADILEKKELSYGNKKKCPCCAELIKAEAKICRFCREEQSI